MPPPKSSPRGGGGDEHGFEFVCRVPSSSQNAEFGDAFFDRGVGHEEFAESAVALEGVDDIERGMGRVGSCRDGGSSSLQFEEGIAEAIRRSGELGAPFVSFKFTGAGNGKLHDHCGKWGDKGHDEKTDWVCSFSVVRATNTAEDGGELGELSEHRDGTSDGRDDGHREGVAIFDVGNFVSDDTENFVGGEEIHESGVDSNGGVGRVATGSECVGAGVVDDIDLGFGDFCALGENLDHAMEVRGLLRRDFDGAGHFDRELVAKPVGTDVHDDGDGEGNDHSGGTTDGVTHKDKESGESG